MNIESMGQSTKTVSVLIAEDHALFSEGVRMTLENTGHFGPVWQATNGKAAFDMALQHEPQLILMDIQMPELNGLQAARLIKAQRPLTKIIMLTSFTDENTVKIALSGGVEAYCSKDIDMPKLVSVIRMVLEGAVYLDPAIANFVMKSYFKHKQENPAAQPPPSAEPPTQQAPKPDPDFWPVIETPSVRLIPADSPPEIPQPRPVEKLEIPKPTPIRTDVLNARELELLSLIADNRTNEEIADILKIGSAWVDGYIKNIITKLAVNNEVEAVRRALEDGAILNAALLDHEQMS